MDNLSTLLGGRFSRVLSRVKTEKALDVVLETSGVALGSDWRVAAQSAVPVVLLDKLDLEFVSPGPFEDVGQGMDLGTGEKVMPFRTRGFRVPHRPVESDAHQDEPHPQTALDQAGAQDQEPGFLSVGERAFDSPADGMLPTPEQERGESADPRRGGQGMGHDAEGLDRAQIPRRVSF